MQNNLYMDNVKSGCNSEGDAVHEQLQEIKHQHCGDLSHYSYILKQNGLNESRYECCD